MRLTYVGETAKFLPGSKPTAKRPRHEVRLPMEEDDISAVEFASFDPDDTVLVSYTRSKRKQHRLARTDPRIERILSHPLAIGMLHPERDHSVADRMQELRNVTFDVLEEIHAKAANKTKVATAANITLSRMDDVIDLFHFADEETDPDIFIALFVDIMQHYEWPKGELTHEEIRRYLTTGEL